MPRQKVDPNSPELLLPALLEATQLALDECLMKNPLDEAPLRSSLGNTDKSEWPASKFGEASPKTPGRR